MEVTSAGGFLVAAGREVSGVSCVSRTIVPLYYRAYLLFFSPACLHLCGRVAILWRGKLINSVRYLAQRRTTSSAPRGERHGLSVTYQYPAELVCCFFSRPAFIFAHASRFCGKLIHSVMNQACWRITCRNNKTGTQLHWRSDARLAAGHEVSGMG